MRCLIVAAICIVAAAHGAHSGEPVPLHQPGEKFVPPPPRFPALYDPAVIPPVGGSFGEVFTPIAPKFTPLYDPTVIPSPGGSFGEVFKPYASPHAPLYDPTNPGLPGGYWTDPQPGRRQQS